MRYDNYRHAVLHCRLNAATHRLEAFRPGTFEHSKMLTIRRAWERWYKAQPKKLTAAQEKPYMRELCKGGACVCV